VQGFAISVSVCLSVCPLAYLKNRVSKLQENFCTFFADGCGSDLVSSNDYAMPVYYVLPGLITTVHCLVCLSLNITRRKLGPAKQSYVQEY